MKAKTKIAGLACLGLAALTSCDTTWEDMTAWSYGPHCDRPTYYAIGVGFSIGQQTDISSAVAEIRNASNIDIRFGGYVGWLAGSAQHPSDTLKIEKKAIPQGGGYGWPGIGEDHFFAQGTVYINPSQDWRPAPSEPSYTGTVNTWRGLILHELLHGFTGIGDRGDNEDGHPGLIMGTGEHTFNKMAAGDLIGAVEKGCRSRQDKDNLINQLRQA